MTNLLAKLTGSTRSSSLGFQQWIDFMKFNGNTYGLPFHQTLKQSPEEAPSTFEGMVNQVYKANGIVFAVMAARLLLFSEARFQWRNMVKGRPGELYGHNSLAPLEKPWPNGTTGDLLSRGIQDADLAGNFFATRKGDRIRRHRPDWVTIIAGGDDPDGLDVEIVGYLYHPGGPRAGKKPITLLPEQVAHFAPIPDPDARWRGMSWLVPALQDVLGDGAMTTHKLRFFENGATANMVVSLDPSVQMAQFKEWVKQFEQENDQGLDTAYKTLYLGGGASASVVGANMRQMDFKVTQGAAETRIAAAGGTPPIIVGLSEGLASATYSNYGQARRRFADGTMRPLWRGFAGAMETLVARGRPNPAAMLWYDDRDISFLQEDQKDAADILSVNAQSIKALVEAGYTPDSAKIAVTTGDLARLEHSGMYSVQLQPAGSPQPALPASTGENGARDNLRLLEQFVARSRRD